MKSIKRINFSTLLNVMVEIASTLDYEGYDANVTTVFPFASSDCDAIEDTTDIVLWFQHHYERLVTGCKDIVVAEVVKMNNNNYHFDGEQLFISTTRTNSGSLLIELYTLRHFDVKGQHFPIADNRQWEKTYIV